MNTVPMFDVMPVTGTFRNAGQFCAVCALGGAPAMVVFVKPESLRGDLLEKVQEISDKYQALQVFVVVLGRLTAELRTQMQEAAASKQLRIPLTVLPNGEIPAALPIDRNAANNVLFYHGQRPFAYYANYDFAKFRLESGSARKTQVRLEFSRSTPAVEVRASDAPPLESAASAMLGQLGVLGSGEEDRAGEFRIDREVEADEH